MKKLTLALGIVAAAAVAAATCGQDLNPWQAGVGHRKAEPALASSATQLQTLWDKATALTETQEGKLDVDDADNFRDTYKGNLGWTYLLVKLKYIAKGAGFQGHWEAYSDPYKGEPCELYAWDADQAKFVLLDRAPENTLFTEARAADIPGDYWVWDPAVEEYVVTLLVQHHNVDGFPDFNVDVVDAAYNANGR